MAGVQPEALSVRHRSRSTVALRLSATDCGFFSLNTLLSQVVGSS